jgi:Mg-chelatase subunit ChlD
MENKRAEIICVLDRSGSMESIRRDAIGGFNAFLAGQKAGDGECRITIIFFNDRIQALCLGEDIRNVEPLTDRTYVPAGSTALLDAVKFAITGALDRLHLDPDRRPIGFKKDKNPPQVIMAILTDGEENASRQATRSEIFELIQTCKQTHHWEFIFLAANQDAIREGARLGIDADRSVNFQATGAGIVGATARMSCMVSEAREAPKKRRPHKARKASAG